MDEELKYRQGYNYCSDAMRGVEKELKGHGFVFVEYQIWKGKLEWRFRDDINTPNTVLVFPNEEYAKIKMKEFELKRGKQ